jgi:hypothetical protein
MRQASKRVPDSAEKTVRDIRRATRRHHSAEEKIRIALEGLRGEDRAVPQGRDQSKPLLPLVERVPGGRQETARRRHRVRRPLPKCSDDIHALHGPMSFA